MEKHSEFLGVDQGTFAIGDLFCGQGCQERRARKAAEAEAEATLAQAALEKARQKTGLGTGAIIGIAFAGIAIIGGLAVLAMKMKKNKGK